MVECDMGGGVSRREPEVHVVVVQSQENGGQVDTQLISKTYKSLRKEGRVEYIHEGNTGEVGERSYQNGVSHDYNNPHRPKHLALEGGGGREEGVKLGEMEGEASNTPDKNDHGMGQKSHDDHVSPNRETERLAHHHHQSQHSSQYSRQGNSSHGNAKHGNSSHGNTNHGNSSQGNINHGNNLSSLSTITMDMNYRGDRRGTGEEFSTISEKAGNIFELFRTHHGDEYTVYVRDDGKRFYVDFEEQKWRYFPDSWNSRGSFVPVDYDPYQVDAGGQDGQGVGVDELTAVREGEFVHPTRGKLATYLKQETLNVMHFFDEVSGAWLPMPISWERHAPNIAPMIAEIQKACPEWKDARGLVSMLRACNYNTDDCTSAYMTINDDGVLDYSDSGPGRDPFRSLTEKKLKDTTSQLVEEKMKNKELNMRLEQLQAKMEELESDNKRMKIEIQTGKQEQRKKSKVLSRQLSHSINFGRSIRLDVVRPLIHILGEETRALKAKFVTLRSVAEKGLSSYEINYEKLTKALTQLISIHRRQGNEVIEVRSLYRKEAMQRKILFNEVQELRGNIRVFCRCRYDDRGRCGLDFDGEDRVVCLTAQRRKKVFEFERVYDQHTLQEKVFDDAKPTITSCVDGYNVCFIAYGQTGSGKTYTMMGTRENPGVNLRSMKELFKICRERTRIRYTLKVSMVEIYNEAVYDLLVSPEDGGNDKLTIQKQGKDVVVPGLTVVEVRSIQDILMLFKEGENNRTVASTKMNTNSSRSHLLFMLKVEGYDTVSKATSRGRLTLVDLAGSERISRSEASGIRLVEAAAINKSLSALGQVFSSIRSSSLHIPYRNSKLTYLLQPCIGGDSKACMFVNVSPLVENMAETISTLEFGTNTRQVALGKATKNVTKI